MGQWRRPRRRRRRAVEPARRWRVDGVASVASSLHPRERARARVEGRRTHDELGPALAAARRRWARWAMVTRCAVASRRAESGIRPGVGFRWPRWPMRALSCACPAEADAGVSMRLRFGSVAPAATATASHSHRACQGDPASPSSAAPPRSGTRLVSTAAGKAAEDSSVLSCSLLVSLQAASRTKTARADRSLCAARAQFAFSVLLRLR